MAQLGAEGEALQRWAVERMAEFAPEMDVFGALALLERAAATGALPTVMAVSCVWLSRS